MGASSLHGRYLYCRRIQVECIVSKGKGGTIPEKGYKLNVM